MKLNYDYIAILKNLIKKIILSLFKKLFILKYCNGKGLEIGPGLDPFIINSKNRKLDFIDKFIKKKNLKIIGENASIINQKENTYNFLISAHCLEHCHDTIFTLKEWKRVLIKGGKLILILPHMLRTFDVGRKLSTLEHHIDDYNKKIDIYDSTHDGEFYEFSLKNIKHQWTDNYKEKTFAQINFHKIKDQGLFHYHVWNSTEMIRVLQYLNLKILLSFDIMPGRSDSFLIVAEK